MDDAQNRRHEMFVRVKDFGAKFSTDFVPTSLGAQLFTQLGTIVGELNGHAAKKVSSAGKAKEGTTTRSSARQALRDDLEALNLTARAMGEDTPGIDDKFRLPRGNNDQNLLDAARAFLADATPMSAQFISHEMPADFLTDLADNIADMEAAISHQSDGVGNRISARAAIDEEINNGMVIVRKLDAIVRNKYANNPGTLAEWTSASHTERAPKRNKDAGGTPADPPGGGSSPAPPSQP